MSGNRTAAGHAHRRLTDGPYGRRVSRLLLAALISAVLGQARAQTERQAIEDAWWTGPLLAANAGTLPQGHLLFEPYFFDSIPQRHISADGARSSVPHENNFGSQSYVNYGLWDSFTVGLIPRLGYSDRSGGQGSSSVQVGDLGVQAQYRLSRFVPDSWIPTSSILVAETLPTGKYDRLGSHAGDGFGGGAYTTSIAYYLQYLSWLPNGRILRTRLDLTYSLSQPAAVRDVSVYGTPEGFRGRVRPGNTFLIDAAGEYSVTRNWVVALDVLYEHDSSTRLSGLNLQQSGAGAVATVMQLSSGESHSVSLAPALEYNFNSRIGVIAGAKLTPWGRNLTQVLIPVAAVNMYF